MVLTCTGSAPVALARFSTLVLRLLASERTLLGAKWPPLEYVPPPEEYSPPLILPDP